MKDKRPALCLMLIPKSEWEFFVCRDGNIIEYGGTTFETGETWFIVNSDGKSRNYKPDGTAFKSRPNYDIIATWRKYHD